MDAFISAIQRLPKELRSSLERLDPQVTDRILEIRLRSGRPPVLVLPGSRRPLTGAAPMTHTELQQCFYALCGNSVHSYQQEIAQGFFTLPGGHRVGVAGIASLDLQGNIQGMRTITSLNLRVARRVNPSLPPCLAEALQAGGGLLLVGPPGSGKTTLLRSIASTLSAQCRSVVMVDERSELMPCTQQGFVFAPPMHCDVLSSVPKAQGILMALRSLSPQVILCDEIGGMEDVAALEQGLYSGVEFVASIHGSDLAGLQARPQFAALQKLGAFRTAAFLEGPEHPGCICRVEPLC